MYQVLGLQDIKDVMSELSLVWPPGLTELINAYSENKIDIKWGRDEDNNNKPHKDCKEQSLEIYSRYNDYKCICYPGYSWLKVIHPPESKFVGQTYDHQYYIHSQSIIFDSDDNLWFICGKYINMIPARGNLSVRKYPIPFDPLYLISSESGTRYTIRSTIGPKGVQWIAESYLIEYDGKQPIYTDFSKLSNKPRSIKLSVTYCNDSYYVLLDNKLFKWNGDIKAELIESEKRAKFVKEKLGNDFPCQCNEAINLIPIENKIESNKIAITSDRNGNLLFLCFVKQGVYEVWCLQLSDMISYLVTTLNSINLNKIQVNHKNDIIVSSSKAIVHIIFM